jgi:hypothetical protein
MNASTLFVTVSSLVCATMAHDAFCQSSLIEVESISGVCTADISETANAGGLGVSWDLSDGITHEPTDASGFEAYPYLDGFCEPCFSSAQPEWWWVYGNAGISESLAVDPTDADPNAWPPNIAWYVSGDVGLDLGSLPEALGGSTADGVASFVLDRQMVLRVTAAVEARLTFQRNTYTYLGLEGQSCLATGDAVCEADVSIDVTMPWDATWAPDIEGIETAVWEGVLQPGTYTIDVSGSGSVADSPSAAGTACEQAQSAAGALFSLAVDVLGPAEATPGDLDGDGDVDGADMGLFLGLWGTSDPSADLNGDGQVDGGDLGLILQAWG